MPRTFNVRRDDALTANIVRSSPLVYDDDSDAQVDERPDHVRAASSLVFLIDRFALVQDDANFLALVDPAEHRVESRPLPPSPDGKRVFGEGRGNIQHKLDLEACAVVPGTEGRMLVAFGSGSDGESGWVVTVDWRGEGGTPDTTLYDLPDFYEGLREHKDFVGAGLNIEGAVFADEDCLRLFQRGNADPDGDLQPCDATGDVSWTALHAHIQDPDGNLPPSVENVAQYELGELHGVRLTFSDATMLDDGITLFSASAENEETGEIVGSVLGIIDADGDARWAELIAEDGSPFNGKVEGLSRTPDERDHVYFVIDSDNAGEPSRVYEADLDGPWYQQF